jgi:hypothetical protein
MSGAVAKREGFIMNTNASRDFRTGTFLPRNASSEKIRTEPSREGHGKEHSRAPAKATDPL